MSALSEAYLARSHCKNGHEYTTANTRDDAKRGRVCRACIRDSNRRQRPNQKTRAELGESRRKHRQLSITLWPTRPPGESVKLNRKRTRDKARAFVIALKDAPCVDCGGRFHHAAMDFDHLPGFTKHRGLSDLSAKGASKRVMLAEIAKCELVCSNCHRVRTFNRAHPPTPGVGIPRAKPPPPRTCGGISVFSAEKPNRRLANG